MAGWVFRDDDVLDYGRVTYRSLLAVCVYGALKDEAVYSSKTLQWRNNHSNLVNHWALWKLDHSETKPTGMDEILGSSELQTRSFREQDKEEQ